MGEIRACGWAHDERRTGHLPHRDTKETRAGAGREVLETLRRGAYSPLDTKYSGRIGLKVRELCTKYGISDRMARYIPDGPLATNKRIAEDIFIKCYQMELESASSYKVWAYRRAGWIVDELDHDILAIYKKRGLNGLKALPNIGPSLAAFIAERLDRI